MNLILQELEILYNGSTRTFCFVVVVETVE